MEKDSESLIQPAESMDGPVSTVASGETTKKKKTEAAFPQVVTRNCIRCGRSAQWKVTPEKGTLARIKCNGCGTEVFINAGVVE